MAIGTPQIKDYAFGQGSQVSGDMFRQAQGAQNPYIKMGYNYQPGVNSSGMAPNNLVDKSYYGEGNMADFNNEEMAFGDAGVAPGMDQGFGQESGFSMPSLDQIGAGAGIAKDLFGMYTANEGLGLAKDQLKMQKGVYADNKANQQRFIGNTQKAFGTA